MIFISTHTLCKYNYIRFSVTSYRFSTSAADKFPQKQKFRLSNKTDASINSDDESPQQQSPLLSILKSKSNFSPQSSIYSSLNAQRLQNSASTDTVRSTDFKVKLHSDKIAEVKSKFSVKPPVWDSKTSTIGKPASIREVILNRNKQNLKNFISEDAESNDGVLTGNVRDVREGILQGLNRINEDVEMDSDITTKDPQLGLNGILPEILEPSEGEMRYLKHQEDVKRKRLRIFNDLPPINEPVRYRRPTQSVSPNVQEIYIDDESKVSDVMNSLNNDIENHTNDSFRQNELSFELSKPLSIQEAKKQTRDRLEKSIAKQKNQLQNSRDNNQNRRFDSNKSLIQRKKATIVKPKDIVIPANGINVREFASKLSLKLDLVVKKLADIGEGTVSIKAKDDDHFLDPDVAELLALELGYNVQRLVGK